MMNLSQFISQHSSILWYPACGTDLRICHHILFNNVYLCPDLIIANDMNNSDKYLIEELEEISKATVIKEEVIQTPALLDGVIQLREISFERQGLVVRKTVLHFWGIRNNIMMDYLVQNQIKINTIFCKRLRGECLLETNLEQSLNLLNTKYFISDLNHLRDGEFDFLRAENFGRQNGLTIKSHSDYSRTIGYNPEYVFCFERQ